MDLNELKAKAESFVGKPIFEVDMKLLMEIASAISIKLRVIGPGEMSTMDYCQDRLNIYKDADEKVTSVLVG